MIIIYWSDYEFFCFNMLYQVNVTHVTLKGVPLVPRALISKGNLSRTKVSLTTENASYLCLNLSGSNDYGSLSHLILKRALFKALGISRSITRAKSSRLFSVYLTACLLGNRGELKPSVLGDEVNFYFMHLNFRPNYVLSLPKLLKLPAKKYERLPELSLA